LARSIISNEVKRVANRLRVLCYKLEILDKVERVYAIILPSSSSSTPFSALFAILLMDLELSKED